VSFNTAANVAGGVRVSADQGQVQPGSQSVGSTDTLSLGSGHKLITLEKSLAFEQGNHLSTQLLKIACVIEPPYIDLAHFCNMCAS